MIHFFRKIRKQFITENKFSKYILYAIGEIFLVVIGILIALQINNWNTEKIKKLDEIKSYENIKRQIIDDRNEISEVKGINLYFSSQYENANKIINANNLSKIDSLAMIAMMLSQISDFHRSGNIYETLVNSGDIKLLKNTEILSRLQKLEMTYTQVNKIEDIHWEVIMKELSPEMRGVINYSNLQIVKPEKLYAVEMQNIFIECIYLTKGKDVIYNRALEEITAIIDLIDVELGDAAINLVEPQ